jgi:two-component system NtrC family sensor kinase
MNIKSLNTKIISAVIIVVVIIEGIILYTNVRELSRLLVEKTEREAEYLGETIKRSLNFDMLKNRRDEVQIIIDNVAGQKGIREVKIFNKQGEITVSSDSMNVGHKVNMKAEACYGCHGEGKARTLLPSAGRTRIFESEMGDRYLGLLNPIYNERACFDCHPKSQEVLGVLDTVISLSDADADINFAKWRMVVTAGISCLAIIVLLNILLSRIVLRRIHSLAEATQEVAAGDLLKKVESSTKDEIGFLTDSFNRMIERIKKDKHEIEEWNKKLEVRVEKKTRQLKTIQKQLMQAGKMIAVGELAAGVAHEINNPMTNILTSAEYLYKKCPDDYEYKEDLDIIMNESIRCRNIVKGLLDFARQSKPEKKETDINRLIESVLLLVQNQAAFQNIKIVRDYDVELPRAEVDSDQIQQVVTNLVINAAEAMDDGGVMTISSDLLAEKEAIEIQVKDTGHGIDEEVMDKIFDPFFTTKGVGMGTGLGLSISYGIVEKHGGRIWATSTQGEGSVFHVVIPLSAKAVQDRKDTQS